MFGIKKSTTTQSTIGGRVPSTSSHALNTIVAGTSIQGDITSENDIRIDGTLVGNLNCQAKVIIGPQGKITGEIHCINAVIEGKFEGILTAKELLSVKEAATVNGTVNINKLSVHSGASFNVDCKMGNASLMSANGSTKNGTSQINKIVKRTTEKAAVAK